MMVLFCWGVMSRRPPLLSMSAGRLLPIVSDKLANSTESRGVRVDALLVGRGYDIPRDDAARWIANVKYLRFEQRVH